MKLFSRKSLVAAATSAALISGVLVAPASAEVPSIQESPASESSSAETPEPSVTETVTVTAEPEVEDPEVEQSSSEEFMAGSSDDDGKLKASAIRDWIAVFTAIIGALSTVFIFAERMN